MAKLILKRSSELNNRMRPYKLYLNGEQFDVIRNGEIKEIPIREGRYELKARIGWCWSEPVVFDAKEQRASIFQISGIRYANYITIIIAVLLIGSLILDDLADKGQVAQEIVHGTSYMIVPFLCYYLYKLTFDRNNFLRIERMK